jgi:ATP-dependent Clp protease ATP-binding subunit ClpB
MDEALSAVKMKSVSKPMEVEILEKELRTLEIELEAKKAEKEDKEIIKNIEKEIASKKEQVNTINSAWKKEKDLIDELKEIRENIEDLKIQADRFERE